MVLGQTLELLWCCSSRSDLKLPWLTWPDGALISCSSYPEGRYHHNDRKLQGIKDFVWKGRMRQAADLALFEMTSLGSACYYRRCDCTKTQHSGGCIAHSQNSKHLCRVTSTNWSLNSESSWECQQNTSFHKCLVSSTQKPASLSWLNQALSPAQHPLNSTVLEIHLVHITEQQS